MLMLLLMNPVSCRAAYMRRCSRMDVANASCAGISSSPVSVSVREGGSTLGRLKRHRPIQSCYTVSASMLRRPSPPLLATVFRSNLGPTGIGLSAPLHRPIWRWPRAFVSMRNPAPVMSRGSHGRARSIQSGRHCKKKASAMSMCRYVVLRQNLPSTRYLGSVRGRVENETTDGYSLCMLFACSMRSSLSCTGVLGFFHDCDIKTF